MNNNSNNSNETSTKTKHHILYEIQKTKIRDDKIVRYNEYSLYLSEFTSGNEEDTDIFKIIHKLRQSKPEDECKVLINSPGGAVSEGLTIMDTLLNNFNNRITTETLYAASSMGSLLFCIGNTRIISRNTNHMMHNYSIGTCGKASDVKSKINFFDSNFEDVIRNIYCGSNKFLSNAEFKQLLDGKEFWFNSNEMIKRNIATHILINGELKTRSEYLKILKKRKVDI